MADHCGNPRGHLRRKLEGNRNPNLRGCTEPRLGFGRVAQSCEEIRGFPTTLQWRIRDRAKSPNS